MFVACWMYHVEAIHIEDFEKAYADAGDWAELFRKSSCFLGTKLMQDSENRAIYITLDFWVNETSRDQFLSEFEIEYSNLGKDLAYLSAVNKEVSLFQTNAIW